VKALTVEQVKDSLKALASEYDVRVPVSLHDGTRALAGLEDGELALAGGCLPAKPTSVFFPQMEALFSSKEGKIQMQEAVSKPILVVGLTAEDAECLTFIDKFFADSYRDSVYFNKREGAVVVVVSGRCGKDGELLKIAGGDCDIELVCDGEKYIAVPRSETGEALAATFAVPFGPHATAGEASRVVIEIRALAFAPTLPVSSSAHP